ncbi:MAG: hypothetical protein ACRDO2_03385 [Nocardioidaceae bacterium]
MPTGSEPDPRILAGAMAMMELRAGRVCAGAHPMGWKLGFGSPSALEAPGFESVSVTLA